MVKFGYVLIQQYQERYSCRTSELLDFTGGRMPGNNSCLSCGACCAHCRVSFYWAEADDVTRGGVPVVSSNALTESLMPKKTKFKAAILPLLLSLGILQLDQAYRNVDSLITP